MKIEMTPQLHPTRGGEVKVGNVYSNAHGKFNYKIVVSVIKRDAQQRPWNNVVCLHINSLSEIVGSSVQPELYISEHQDLVGIVHDMPVLRVEWFKEPFDRT